MKLFRRYWFLKTAQVRNRLIPHDHDASITRGRLRRLVQAGYLRRHQPKMVDPLLNGTASPVFVLTCKGASVLAAVTGDESYLLPAEASFANWMSLWHYCRLASLHMILDDALAGKSYIRQTALIFEHELANPEAKEPSNRYKLHTTVSKPGEKPVYFCPDSAFETEVKGHRRAWLTEYEMGSDSPRRVFAKKSKGVIGFANGNHLKTIFPGSRDFRVIAFCPNVGWMKALRDEFKGKPGAEHWLFCATPEVKVDTFLHEPIMYKADKEPVPFLSKPTEGFPVGGAVPERDPER